MDEAGTSLQYLKDPNRLTKTLVLFLWIYLFSNVLGIVLDINSISLLNDFKTGKVNEFELDQSNYIEALFGDIWLLLFTITGIFFLKWIYRANRNCRGFGANDMRFSSGWSVGWYFIPVMNLFMPFKAMKEIWLVSIKGPENWQIIDDAGEEKKGVIVLKLWWTLWTGALVLPLVLPNFQNSQNLEQLINVYYISVAHYFWQIILTLIAIKIVKTIQDNQNRLVSRAISFNQFPRKNETINQVKEETSEEEIDDAVESYRNKTKADARKAKIITIVFTIIIIIYSSKCLN